MRRSATLVAAIVAAVLAMTACSKKDGGGDGEENAPPPPAAPAGETREQTNPPPGPGPGPTQDPFAAVYSPTSVPARFALALPGSILIDQGAGLRLTDGDDEGDGYSETWVAEEAPEPEAPDETSSQGLEQLKRIGERFSARVGDLTMTFYGVDQVIGNNTDCKDLAPCEVENATVKLTREMVNAAIANAGGKDYMTEEELDYYLRLVGTEIEFGTVTVARLSNDPKGYETSVKIENVGLVREIMFDGDFALVGVRVDESSSWTEEIEGSEPQVFTYSTKYAFHYDARGTLLITDENDYDGFKDETQFAIEADPESDSGGIRFNLKSTYESADGDGYYTEINGFADDGGAYLRTVYRYNQLTVDFTLDGDGTLAPYEQYYVYPGGTLLTDVQSSEDFAYASLGNVSIDDEGNEYGWYDGPATSGVNLPLFKVEWVSDEAYETWTPVFTAVTDVTVTGVTKAISAVVGGYEEVVDAKGNVTSYCYYENGDFDSEGYCSAGDLDGDYKDTYYEEAGEDGEFEPVGFVEATISGVSFAEILGGDLYILRSVDGLSALNDALATEGEYEDDDIAWYDHVIGYGYFIGDDYTAENTSGMDDYRFSYWGLAEEASEAVVVRMVYDEDGGISFQVVDGASVTTSVVE